MIWKPQLGARPLKMCWTSRSHYLQTTPFVLISVMLGWGLSHFRNLTGKRGSHLYAPPLNGLSSTNLPTFSVQKAMHLAYRGKFVFFTCLRWGYWPFLPLWRVSVPDTVSGVSWMIDPGDVEWHCVSESQGLIVWPIFKEFNWPPEKKRWYVLSHWG